MIDLKIVEAILLLDVGIIGMCRIRVKKKIHPVENSSGRSSLPEAFQRTALTD